MRNKFAGILAMILSLSLIAIGCSEQAENPVGSSEALSSKTEETAMAAPASACTPLRVSSDNLYILLSFPEWAYPGGKLVWFFGRRLNVAYERNKSGYTQHADNHGYYWGQCVSSCKALSRDNTVTRQWVKGSRVINGGVSRGTVIATFYGGTYYGHAAILKDYIRDGRGNITGIEVWDQNWYPQVFGKHNIDRRGSGVVDADNYYAVLVP